MAQYNRTNTPMNHLAVPTDLPQAKEIRIVASQAAIINETANYDTIVIYSPGPIKNFIALETINRVGVPAIFIVPVSSQVRQKAKALRQYAKTFEQHRNTNVQQFCGDMQVPGSFDILVTTPIAFETVRSEYGLHFLQWHRIKCVIFDEAHEVFKHRAYRKLVLDMRRLQYTRAHSQPHVLALSQVWAGEDDREAYKRSIDSLSNDLKIDRIRVALDNDGDEALADTGPRCLSVLDMTPITPQLPPPSEKKAGPMLPTFLSRVENQSASPLCCILTKCVLSMEATLSERDETFLGCVLEGKGVKEWTVREYEEKFIRIKEKHDLVPMYSQLEYWYEALRQLIISWEQDVFLAVLYLRMFCCDTDHARKIWSRPVQGLITKFWALAPVTFPRLNRLRDILSDKLSDSRNVRGHLLVKQKVTAHVLEYFISNDSKLCPYFSPACLYAPTAIPSGTFCMSKIQFTKNLEAFAKGSANLLITTNVNMEGLELSRPEWVVRFDDVQQSEYENHATCDTNSSYQSNNPSAIDLEKVLAVAQPKAQSSVKLHSMDSFISACSGPSNDENIQTARLSQKKLEDSAAQSLFAGHLTTRNVLFKLNIFCQNTNTVLQETCQKDMSFHFSTSMTYKSAVREVTGSACGSNKTVSRRLAALVLVENLKLELKNDKSSKVS